MSVSLVLWWMTCSVRMKPQLCCLTSRRCLVSLMRECSHKLIKATKSTLKITQTTKRGKLLEGRECFMSPCSIDSQRTFNSSSSCPPDWTKTRRKRMITIIRWQTFSVKKNSSLIRNSFIRSRRISGHLLRVHWRISLFPETKRQE